jgi:hypothetical protein
MVLDNVGLFYYAAVLAFALGSKNNDFGGEIKNVS